MCYIYNNIVRLMVLKHFPSETRLSNNCIYKSINLLQLKEIYKLELAKFMHKAYYKALPECLNNMFTRINTVHRYPTSSSTNRVFYQHRTMTVAYRNWVSSAGVDLWATIDSSLRECNFFIFRKRYREYLINSY